MYHLKARIQSLSRSQGIRQSLLMMFGNAAAQGFSAIALILISRMLGPSKFGEFSLGFAIALILNRFCDLGLSFAIQKYVPKARSNDEVNRLVSYTTRVKLIVIVIEVLIGLLTYRWIAQVLHFDNELIILMAFLLSPATVLYEHFQAVLQSMHRFSQSVIMNVIQAFTKAAAAGLFWFGHLTASMPMLAMYLVAPLLPVLVVRKLLPKWFSLKPFSTNYSSERNLTKAMISHSAVGYMAAGIIENIDILFVQGYLSTYETGLLGGVSRVALLVSLMAFSLGTVLNPRVATYTSTEHLRRFVKKAMLLLVGCVVGFLAYLLVAEWVLILTVGSEYLSGLTVMNILVASSFMTLAVIPFMALFFSFDAPWYFSVSGVIQLIIIVVGNVVLVPMFGLEASAWTRLISRTVLFIFTIAVAGYLYRQQAGIEARNLARVVKAV